MRLEYLTMIPAFLPQFTGNFIEFDSSTVFGATRKDHSQVTCEIRAWNSHVFSNGVCYLIRHKHPLLAGRNIVSHSFTGLDSFELSFQCETNGTLKDILFEAGLSTPGLIQFLSQLLAVILLSCLGITTLLRLMHERTRVSID